MSFNITKKLEIKANGRVEPRPVPPARGFSISPAWSGKTVWNLDVDGPLNIGTSGSWTITPLKSFSGNTKMWGDGGRASFFVPYRTGGGGGFSSGSISFYEGVPYKLVVSYNRGPNSNGGLSGIFSGSIAHGNSIMIAGGGGNGATSTNGAANGRGGAGGGTTGQNGLNDSGTSGQFGYGGTQSAGGAKSSYAATNGGPLAGGLANSYGCDGGAGYYGGGGGNAGGSGGGSGYIHPTLVVSGSLVAGSASVPGNSADAYRSGSGTGGPATSNATGSYGRVVIF